MTGHWKGTARSLLLRSLERELFKSVELHSEDGLEMQATQWTLGKRPHTFRSLGIEHFKFEELNSGDHLEMAGAQC